jgi:two-component system nitrate/nitrite response regulator NarL
MIETDQELAVSNQSLDEVRILLVDDHAMIRDGIARMLDKEADFVVVGQVGSVADGIAELRNSSPGIVLLDVDLGSERAIDFVKSARAEGFEGKILIVTAGMSDQEAIQLVQAGVSGILHKHHPMDVLCETIRKIARGDACLEQTYLEPLFRAMDRTRAPKRATLTERDRTVLRGILQGWTNRQIAEKLEISEGAVKASVRHVCEKLNVRTRSQLVKVALEQYKDQL